MAAAVKVLESARVLDVQRGEMSPAPTWVSHTDLGPVGRLKWGRDDLHGDPVKLAAFRKEEDDILAEDLAILERYPHRQLYLDRTVETHTKADRLSLGWRDLVAAM